MNKEGEILKDWVESKGYEGQEVADMLGLTSRQGVYPIYKREVLSNKHKEALAKYGFDVNKVSVKKVSDSKPEGNSLKEALEQIMEAYNSKFARLEKDHENTKKELYKLRGEFDLVKGMVIKQPTMAKK